MNISGSPLCLPSADGAFGPIVDGCRDNFDFTFTFEQYFFSIVPSAIILLAAPLRVYFLHSKRRRVRGNAFKFVKLSAIAVFAVLQLTSIVLWAAHPQLRVQGPSITASTLSFVTSLMLCALSYVEHSKSLAPSLLLNAYLFLSFTFDAVILRTLWLTPFNIAIRNIFTASFTMKGIILLLEAKEKREFFSSSDKQRSPEEISGLYSQGLFWWLNSTIIRGFRHVLKPDDLHEVDEDISAEVLDSKFWRAWKNSFRKGKYKLILVTMGVLKWPILLPVIPRLALIGFTFCQPFLVNRLLDYLQVPTGDLASNIGYALIGAYGLVYFGMAISNGFYAHRSVRCMTMVRGILVTAIFRKTTEISITALDDSAAVTLMSADVESIVRGLREVHDIWAAVIQITLATWLLQREIGLACLAPVIVSAVSSAISIKLSTFTKARQMVWFKEIQKRVGITSTMLGSMKGIKMSGLSQRLSEIIRYLRIKEVQVAKKFRLLNVYGATLGYVPVMISPVATFAIFTLIAFRDGTSLDVSRMFTSLSLILLLTQPLFYVFLAIESLMASIGCFERIGKFLMSETRMDHRLMSSATSQGKLSESFSGGSIGLRGESHNGIELANFRPIRTRSSSVPEITGSSAADKSPAIMVSSGTFGWTQSGIPTLHDINLSVPHSKLTLLVGPVASGKSTLLKGLLGETLSSKGFVHVSSKEIAWCEQTPWLINASVQRNIIGFSNFDTDLYNAVVFACDLDQDISQFPDGDQSLVGSKGITLSGGQKQRIAIARAAYGKKDIAMFDDIFSGLDSTTETKVFGRLFGPQGLLRRWEKTVVIATHAVNLLPHADHIIALGNGTVLEQGTFQELNTMRGYIHSFCLNHANDSNAAESSGDTAAGNTYSLGKKQDSNSGAGLPAGKDRQMRDLSVYHYYFESIGGKYACIFLVLEVLWAFFSTFPTVWLKWWTDANASQPNEQDGLYLGVYSTLQITGLLSQAALVWFCFNFMVQKSGLRLHEILLKTVMSAPLAFFAAIDTGSITTRFSQDIQLIDTQLPLALSCVVLYIFVCTAQAVLIASATFYIALSFPALLLVFYFLQKYYLRTSRQLRFMDLEEKAPVYTQFIETLSGLTTIRAFHWQEHLKIENYTLVNRSQKPFYLLFVGQRWLTLVLDLITMAMAVLVVGLAVKMRGTASVGLTGVALTQLISFTANMKLLISFWTQLETSIGAVARIKQFATDTKDENLPGECLEPPADWPSKGEIRIENVSAKYNSSDHSENLALDDISLHIKAGERIGICGRTGSGKSTLILTLLRLLDPLSGTISIDALPLTSIPRSTIRSRINALSQEVFFLTSLSVRQNLDPYGAATDEACVSVLRKVGLWEAMVAKGGAERENGSPRTGADGADVLDMELKEDILSHGQKQLFCLARALLRPGKVVVLDEVSSSIDRQTDQLIQTLIRSAFAGRTIIAIAHRLDTIQDFDRVVVMDRGRIVEVGEPRSLMARPGGWLRAMVEGRREG